MPGHGESQGFHKDHFIATNAIDKLKEVFFIIYSFFFQYFDYIS